MPDRMYYSQQAREQARRERLLIAGLAAGVGIVAGTVASLIWGGSGRGERLFGESFDELLHQGGEQARKAAEELLKNATRVKNGVAEQVDLVTGS